MEKLTYDILKQFVDYLEVTDVDVKRLGDDSSEIHPGDDVAFVATASFRLTHGGVDQLRQLKGDWKTEDLAVGDVLFVIGADGHVRSDKLPLDEDSVIRWLVERYEFKFLLNGSEHGPFRSVGRIEIETDSSEPERHKLALPWIRKLDTAAVRGDYIDVDVKIDQSDQIDQRSQAPMRREPHTTKWPIANVPAMVDGQKVFARLEIDSPEHAARHLLGRTFHVPVESEHGHLRLTLTFSSDPGAPPPGDAPPPGSAPPGSASPPAKPTSF